MIDTEFTNHSLSIENFPTIVNLDKQPLSDKYAPVNRVVGVVLTLSISSFFGALYFQSAVTIPSEFKNLLPFIIWGVLGVGFLVTAYKSVADKHKFYALRSLDLHYFSGLFFCKTVSQPITRIQHIELKRGPIERKVGLATLQVFSAGGAMYTFAIPGLPVKKAQYIRQFIVEHRDIAKHG